MVVLESILTKVSLISTGLISVGFVLSPVPAVLFDEEKQTS